MGLGVCMAGGGRGRGRVEGREREGGQYLI